MVVVAARRFKETMSNTVGHRTTELALQLGLLYSPAEALKVGLVDQLVPEDQVLATSLQTMTKWLAIPGSFAAARPGSDSADRAPPFGVLSTCVFLFCFFVPAVTLRTDSRSVCSATRPRQADLQVHDEEARHRSAAGQQGGRHPALCQLHHQGVHPEVARHVPGDAEEEEGLKERRNTQCARKQEQELWDTSRKCTRRLVVGYFGS